MVLVGLQQTSPPIWPVASNRGVFSVARMMR